MDLVFYNPFEMILENSNRAMNFLANIGYYEDQYPSILSCHEKISHRDALRLYCNQTNLFPLEASRVGLYIHIPFCKTQCLYCDCTVRVENKEEEYDRYLDCLEKEAILQRKSYGGKIPLETCYIGG
jgi:coproporphyrinogen III oxidase-like Fe-S oxidoreductase